MLHPLLSEQSIDHVGENTYEDVWDETTQEELGYYKRKKLETPPEQRYINPK
jgi:hypothetical protein